MATRTDQDASTPIINKAIDNADEATLCAILKSICQGSETCRQEVIARILVSQKHEIIVLSDSSDDETQKQHAKRQRTAEDMQIPKIEKCETYNKTYDIALNNDKVCRTYEGWIDIDADYFPDDDDIQYRPDSINPETDWRREEFPEGFIWQCCEEPANGTPCRIQRHIPKKC